MRKLCRAIPALLSVAVALAACAAQSAPATAPATVAAAPATSQPATTSDAAAAPADWLNTATVDGDYYVLGNPGAAVRRTDYSDFL